LSLCDNCIIEGGYEIQQINGDNIWVYTGAPTNIFLEPPMESTIIGLKVEHHIGKVKNI